MRQIYLPNRAKSRYLIYETRERRARVTHRVVGPHRPARRSASGKHGTARRAAFGSPAGLSVGTSVLLADCRLSDGLRSPLLPSPLRASTLLRLGPTVRARSRLARALSLPPLHTSHSLRPVPRSGVAASRVLRRCARIRANTDVTHVPHLSIGRFLQTRSAADGRI